MRGLERADVVKQVSVNGLLIYIGQQLSRLAHRTCINRALRLVLSGYVNRLLQTSGSSTVCLMSSRFALCEYVR